jgi:phosphoribosylglycinamide formyltransferase-1
MAPARKVRVAILISGRGSNMVALAEAARREGYPAEIVLVLANDPLAEGLARAASLGLPTRAIDHRGFPDRATFDAAIDAALREAEVDLVCLAGFMRILTPAFVEGWAGRMLNIHPSLLPLFKGTHTHAQALAAGVRLHGCTVHFVVPELDAGPIVAQAAVPVCDGDDPDSLAARVIVQERWLYPAALALVASGSARLEGGRVAIDTVPPDGVLFSL